MDMFVRRLCALVRKACVASVCRVCGSHLHESGQAFSKACVRVCMSACVRE